MTGEEAIRVLQTYGHNCKCCAKEGLEASKVAIAALEKQIPKVPDLEGDGYDKNGEIILDTWICPGCGESYEVDYEKHDYCPNCGQAIDWREQE